MVVLKKLLAIFALFLSGCLESSTPLGDEKPVALKGTEYLDEGGEIKFRYLEESGLYRDTVSPGASGFYDYDYYYLWNLGYGCIGSLQVDVDAAFTEGDTHYLEIVRNQFEQSNGSILSEKKVEINKFKNVVKMVAIVNVLTGPRDAQGYVMYQTEMYFFIGLKRAYFLIFSRQSSTFESDCRGEINWYLENFHRQ
jgi:hypothetical protein